jgi:hypothetical protein
MSMLKTWTRNERKKRHLLHTTFATTRNDPDQPCYHILTMNERYYFIIPLFLIFILSISPHPHYPSVLARLAAMSHYCLTRMMETANCTETTIPRVQAMSTDSIHHRLDVPYYYYYYSFWCNGNKRFGTPYVALVLH